MARRIRRGGSEHAARQVRIAHGEMNKTRSSEYAAIRIRRGGGEMNKASTSRDK